MKVTTTLWAGELPGFITARWLAYALPLMVYMLAAGVFVLNAGQRDQIFDWPRVQAISLRSGLAMMAGLFLLVRRQTRRVNPSEKLGDGEVDWRYAELLWVLPGLVAAIMSMRPESRLPLTLWLSGVSAAAVAVAFLLGRLPDRAR